MRVRIKKGYVKETLYKILQKKKKEIDVNVANIYVDEIFIILFEINMDVFVN